MSAAAAALADLTVVQRADTVRRVVAAASAAVHLMYERTEQVRRIAFLSQVVVAVSAVFAIPRMLMAALAAVTLARAARAVEIRSGPVAGGMEDRKMLVEAAGAAERTNEVIVRKMEAQEQ